MSRTFEIAKCCLNCEHRKMIIDANVICKLDNKWRSDRLVCSGYLPTTNTRIQNAEKKLLPNDESGSQRAM